MKTGLFGGDWEDFIQPVNDHFDNAINQIQSQGAHGELARMQAMDEALGANVGNGTDNAGPGLASFAGGEGLQYGTDLPTGNPGWSPQDLSDSGRALQYSPGDSRVREVSFHPGGGGSGSTGGSRDIPPLGQPGPQSAAGLGNSIFQNPVRLQDAVPKDPNQRNANIAAGNTDQSSALTAFANSPRVSSALDSAWAQSHPNGYIDQRREINAFGRQNAAGDIWVEPANTLYDDSNISVVPAPPGSGILGKLADTLSGNKTIFVIHTHPNPGDFKTTGPSQEDIDYARSNNQPFIIQSTDGLHFYDPAQHK